ncbi:FtsX-like permease family protein [Gracilibacillus phocaeensis]|uniref:FtsX-like permease family protein n=1 Tax=Gracilibacillus phocaeensis TaxID=2042304 RepID=UPI0010304F06|nr:FtsX-like permease family protein [Gracilibacillus phocaeensis]
MKKLIFVLFATTFILISFLSIKQFEFLQFQNFNYHPTNEIWDVVIESGNKDLNKADNFTLLTDMTNEAKINLQRESYESNDKGEDKLVYYVSLSDTDTYYADIKLASGNYIDNESNENEYISTIATNDKNQIGKIELFHSFDPIEIRPMIAAQNTRDIKGSYTITSGGDPKQFEHLGLSNGFSIEVSRNTSQVMFSQYPYNEILYQTTIILCLLIMLAMFYDISNNYKEVAVRYLLGYNFPEIGGYILKRYWITIVSSLLLVYIGLMLFLFIYNGYQQLGDFLVYWLKNMESLFVLIIILLLFTWLATWKISIPNMIKNKKPIKLTLNLTILTRLVLALILVLTLEQGIGVYKELKSTADYQEKWSILKEYSYLGVISSGGSFDFGKEDEKNNRFNQFYKELEEEGAFLILPSYYYMDYKQKPLTGVNRWGM